MSTPAEIGTPAHAPRRTPGRGRNLLALLTAVLGAAAVASAVSLLTVDRKIVVSPNVFINPEGLIDANNSASVAMNPRNPRNLVVTQRLDRPGFTARLHWSMDSGGSWITTNLPLPAGTEGCAAPPRPGELCPFAPDAAFGPDGTLYVTYVHLVGRGNTPEALWLSKSTDGGRTLSLPVKVTGKFTFQVRVAVDAGGAVHVTWVKPDDVGLLRFVGQSRVVHQVSTDGGKTFSEPVAVSDPDRQRVGAPTPVVDSRGNIAVLYEDFRDDVRDYENLEGPAWDRPFALVVTRSTDGGKTWSKGVEVDGDVLPTRRFLIFLPEFPSIAAGPGGTLYVAWADGRNGDLDAFLRRSGDFGATWGPLVRLGDNPQKDGTSQYQPRVAAAPGGRVDVVFYDRRNDPSDVMSDVYLATSPDGERAFANLRLTSKAFDARVGPAGGNLEADLGSRIGLASWDAGAFAAWTDTRQGTEATGRQDIVGARVDMPDFSGLARRRLLVVALLIAAAVALAAWRMRGPGGSARG